jgi:hypothetical protein
MNILVFFLITATLVGISGTRRASDDLANKIEQAIEEAPAEEPVIIAPPDAPATAHGGTEAPLTTSGLQAEDQTPTGQFTTATEVKPILSMTKQSWVAVREYDGKDIVYFTNLLAWRCGVLQITYQINDGAETVFDAEPCQLDYATPNAMVDVETYLPYIEAPLKSVESVRVHVVYDDLSEDEVTVSRKEVLMP